MVRKDFKYGMLAGAAMVVIATMAVSFWPSDRFEVDLPPSLQTDEQLDVSERQIIEQARQENKLEPAVEIPKTTDFQTKAQTDPSQAPAASNDTEPATVESPQYLIHVVQSGETLSSISRKYYGNPNLWRRIIDANRGQIPDGVTIRPGMELRIPANQ